MSLGDVDPVADILPEPLLLVRRDGAIEAANRAFIEVFGWQFDDLAGVGLPDLAVGPTREEIGEYLRHCLGTSVFLPGTLTLRCRDSSLLSCRAEGASMRVRGHQPLIVLRLVSRQSAVARFINLTEKVEELGAEVVRRRRAEALAAEALEREQRVRERLSALTEASGALVASLAVRDVLPSIGALAERLIPADAHAVWQCDPASGTWSVVWQRGLSDTFATMIATWAGRGGSGAPIGEPLFVERIDEVPFLAERRAAYAAEGIQALCVIPLRVHSGASFGTVAAYYRRQISIGVDDRRVAAALCHFASSALTMATLYEAESTSRIAAEAAERRAEFLSKASATVAASLDYEETLNTIARLAVPEFADWCVVDVLDERGELARVAVVHNDPEKIEIAQKLQERYPPDPESPYGPAHAVRTARPVLIPRFPDELIEKHSRDAEHRRLVRALGLKSYICAPLVVHGRALGALTLVSAESGREYSVSDVRVAQDLASRVALALENARAYRQARHANQTKEEFLATLSHELRTPLNAVLGYARLIRSGVLTPDKRNKALEVLERNAAALNQIVEDVLDVSRIVAGKIRLAVQPVDLAVVLQNAVATVLLAAQARGVALETASEPAAPLVLGDPDRLQQVVWNLLTNAVKFTPRGGRVELRLEQVDSGVQIVISDTGAGIKPDFLPYLFDRFTQADGTFAREHGGLGLGLAIARHIVEMHGGTIAAASDGEGRGATFYVRLPVVATEQRSETSGPPARPRFERPQVRSDQLDGVRVLVVDDDPDALDLIADILVSAGARVETARSGRAALDCLAMRDTIDLVVSDIAMPQMDGLALIAELRRSPNPRVSAIPAIALTAYVRSEERVRALDAGYQLHVAKPVSPSELIAAVKSIATRPRIEPQA